MSWDGSPWAESHWPYLRLKRELKEKDKIIEGQIVPKLKERIRLEIEADLRKRIEKEMRADIRRAVTQAGRSFEFEPTTEAGVILLFGRFYDLLGFDEIVHAMTACPDCIARKGKKEIRIEFEFKASNFILHRHDPRKVNMVVCWEKDRELNVPVIELKSRLSPYRVKPQESAPSNTWKRQKKKRRS